jgi:predicted CXXCH cytochrome family protein
MCHPRIAKSPHPIAFFTGRGHPLKGRKEPKSRDGKLSCVSCHNPHSSDYPRLFKYPANKAYELCKYCHEFTKK